jgi:hypothetical protein
MEVYRCSICNRKIKTLESCDRHIQEIHNEYGTIVELDREVQLPLPNTDVPIIITIWRGIKK